MGKHARSFILLGLTAGLLLPSAAAAQEADAATVWAALNQLTIDPQQVAAVSGVTIERDLGRISLREGTLGFSRPVNGRVVLGAFRGRGVFSIAPRLPFEMQQLQFHTGGTALAVEFTEEAFVFSDSAYDDFAKQVTLGAGDAGSLTNVFSDRSGEYKNRNHSRDVVALGWGPRLLQVLTAEQKAPLNFFQAQMKTSKYDWITFSYDEADLEEIGVGQWAKATWLSFPAKGRHPDDAFKDPNARELFRLLGQKLDIRVDDKAHLDGIAEVRLHTKVPGLRVLVFNLSPNLQVSKITDGAGSALTYFQPPSPNDPWGDEFVAVVLPAPTQADQEMALRFEYTGDKVVTKEGAGVFFAQSGGWYPTYGYEFAQRYDFELTLSVPKKYTAVAVGDKVKEYEEGGYKITQWTSGKVPLAVAGFSFGNFRVKEEKRGNAMVQVYITSQPDKYMKDIQTTVSTYTDESNPLQGLNPELTALESLSPARLSGNVLKEVGNSLQVFEEYFGAYPYGKLAVTNIPWGYGQGWPSLLYVSAITFTDSTQRHVLFGGRLSAADQLNITDRFRAHETSHQWWGHVVGWKSYHDQWLSEGFAEFSGLLYLYHRRGPKEFLEGLRLGREELLSKDRNGAVNNYIGPIYSGFRLSSYDHPGGYSTIVYTKGGWVLHMLRMQLLDFRAQDPDERFKAMMKDFTKTHYNQAASTRDFQRIAEKYMTDTMDVDGNRKLDWFFNQWVYGTAIPHYQVSYQITPGGKGSKLSVNITQSNVPTNFVMPVPIYVHQGKKAIRLGWLPVSGQGNSFEIDLPYTVDKVTINEWEDVLCTVDYKK